MKTDKISFTSKLNFVNSQTFVRYRRGAYVDFRKEYERECASYFQKKKIQIKDLIFNPPRKDIIKSPEFFLDEVRTCSSGGIVNTETGEAVGYHIYDCLNNYKNLDKIFKYIFSLVKNPDRALFLGGKDLKNSQYSMPIAERFVEELSKRVPNVTVFKEHAHKYSESDLHYAVKDDKWTIHSIFSLPFNCEETDVLSEELLAASFKEIKIANGDVLYINNNKISL